MLALAGVAAGVWWALPGVGVVLWAAAVVFALVRVWRGEPLLVQRRTSQNIIGTQAVQTPKRRVVVLAALDTLPIVRGGIWWERLSLWPWWGQVLCAAAGTALAGLEWWWQVLCVIPLALPALGELARARTAYSPGANHAAAALALLVATAETAVACDQTEIWLVALGASSGGAGLRDLLHRYPFEPQQTIFIGLEGPGIGTPAVITREGVLLQHAADAELLRVAAAADAADPRIDLEPRPFRGPTLVRTVRGRGMRWVTLAGLDSAGQMPNRASTDDTLSAIDQDALERSLRLVTSMVRLIDQEGRSTPDARQPR